MKLLSRPLPLPTMLLWVVLLHSGTFADVTMDFDFVPGLKHASLKSSTIKLHPDRTIHLDSAIQELNHTLDLAQSRLSHLERLENSLKLSQIQIQQGTPSHGMYLAYEPDREAIRRGLQARLALTASRTFQNTFCSKNFLTEAQCNDLMTQISFEETNLKSTCQELRKTCSQNELQSPYRSISASCNNPINGAAGESFTGYLRLVPAQYLDQMYEPRRAHNKHKLPSPRSITLKLTGKKPLDDDTLSTMQWGQFIGHDLSRTAISTMVHSENSIECCQASGKNLSPRYHHPFCRPIQVPNNDPFYAKQYVNCMSYVRSIPALKKDCSVGAPDQMNQATHFLDASQLYGITKEKALDLRTLVGGQLKMDLIKNEEYLKLSETPCLVPSCFTSGDSRVNFQPQITVLYTIWYREHNRLALNLQKLNPHWSDQKLYEEARRLVIAQYQHITYDWAKNLLGPNYFKKIQETQSYNQKINPAVSNSFATAAIPALQGLAESKTKLLNENRDAKGSLQLQATAKLVSESLDDIIRGLTTQRTRKLNINLVDELKNFLYSTGGYGFDFLSLAIQRGRDHGLPSYTTYRKLCGLNEVNQFEDLSDVLSNNQIENLQKIYNHTSDIDLIVGSMMEDPAEGSALGPTLSCIITEQLIRTRQADRFFYTNPQQPNSFTKEQIQELSKVTLARIFCDDSNDIKLMQPNVFAPISSSNNLVSCQSPLIPKLNLNLWTDKQAA